MMNTQIRSLSHHRRVITATPDWWDPGRESLAIWAAYQAKGAGSLADSYTDLSGNGRDCTVGAAPAWDAANGWKFDGSSHYLRTTFVPDADLSQTVILQFSNVTNTGAICGCYTATGVLWYFIKPDVDGSNLQLYDGNAATISPRLLSGNYAMAGGIGYRNGSAEAPTCSAKAGTRSSPLAFGAIWNGSSAVTKCAGYIQAAAIYSTALTAAQVAAVATAMAAL